MFPLGGLPLRTTVSLASTPLKGEHFPSPAGFKATGEHLATTLVRETLLTLPGHDLVVCKTDGNQMPWFQTWTSLVLLPRPLLPAPPRTEARGSTCAPAARDQKALQLPRRSSSWVGTVRRHRRKGHDQGYGRRAVFSVAPPYPGCPKPKIKCSQFTEFLGLFLS